MIVYPARDIRPFVMYCVNGKTRSSLLIESTDSMIIIIIILQWTWRDSVLSSDARLHVNPIYFLARRAECYWFLVNSTQSKSKFPHQTCSKLTSTTPLLHTKTAASLLIHRKVSKGSRVSLDASLLRARAVKF